MAEPKRDQIQEEDEQRRRGAETSPAPVYDDETRRQQSALYEQIAARGPFRYDAEQDPLYRTARDRYVQEGRMAMKDSMGQAAALTGGYDSSYGQAVGQQQYDASLRGLSELIPELYQQAYRMYRDQGDALEQQYELLGKQADRDYDRYRDELGDWRTERDWQQDRENDAYDRAADAYARLYALISATGYSPTAEELAAAGMSQEAAEALRYEYLRQTGQLPSTSGGDSGGYYTHSSAKKLKLSDVEKAMDGVKHSNRQKELFESYREAIENGKASFTLQELNQLFRDHHWHS
jgi:hypothetical protein